ncbi:quaternary amine ABC transporter ATP-binding protein [Alkalibacter saccharofermentans]|uniref:Quaternary amine transport ATP-binding protein n=1 Tax=Alkalibacter saccharofermentans DSM 14828 TaxID=1120975 RepID=A0A1M4VL04_9FIRM|nr:glycine betaine/L-proline ABC transporter ATP-binding protein [Alkalibacter saccharofermentans]SHE69550.1 glycine betaine/proline transport system ATP-binding protein [Alkalibacter saccharofermentans DSM 14828]
MAKKISFQHVVKIFGNNPKTALEMLKQGKNKDEILEKTKHVVGINDASFEVNEGEIFVVMGLSGSGKSTLIRCINRLIDVTSGSILIDGEDITKMNKDELTMLRRKKMGMVFQKFALLPNRTIQENVQYGLEIQGVDIEAQVKKARESLDLVGLKGWYDSYPHELSGGMQQRVGLARALAVDPDILLMDEAFSALDPLIRKEMQDELLDLQNKMNKTIVFITHDLDEALKIGDRIALMKDGAIVQVGTPEDILNNPNNEYVARFVEDVDVSKVLTAEDIMIKPITIDYKKDGCRVGLRKMEKESVSNLFVVDRSRKLIGYVVADDLSELVKKGESSIESAIHKNIPTVSPDTKLTNIFHLIAESRVPVAVIDEENTLKGIIIRGSVISGLVRGGGEDAS